MKLSKQIWLFPCLLSWISLLNAFGDTNLWYNGDYAGGSGTVNEHANVGTAEIYDDFTVTSTDGWIIQQLWSNDCMSINGVTSAAWSIRSGLSAGSGGTIIAAGVSAAQQLPTGRTAWWGYPEYTIEVNGLNIFLGPGTYWLSVSPLVGNDPLSNGQYESYISQSSGGNTIGTPAGNDGNSFLYDPPAGHNFSPDPFNEDYSMGIAGTVVPEPSSWIISITSGICVLVARRKKIQRDFFW